MKKTFLVQEGFTLVELLIVIALIGILSVAVLATINPIEQTNKARDAKFKNDAAEVLSAYERYYASQNAYPWNMIGTTLAIGSTALLSSTSVQFGVSEPATETKDLISTSELKNSFAGKDPFVGSVDISNMMYAYSNGSSNYVCFCPSAQANRTGSMRDKLKCVGATAMLNIGAGCTQPTATTGSTYCTPSATAANMLCVPDGTIQ